MTLCESLLDMLDQQYLLVLKVCSLKMVQVKLYFLLMSMFVESNFCLFNIFKRF